MKYVIAIILIGLSSFSAPRAYAKTVGQWVWSPRDVATYNHARKDHPDLTTATQIGTLVWDATIGDFNLRLGLSPKAVANNKTVVVRIDDRLHAAWNQHSTEYVAARVNAALAKLRDFAAPLGSNFVWQLDYDAPISKLPHWAATLRTLRDKKGALLGHKLWITSLISHVRSAQYALLMQPVIDGHILQIFETGTPLSEAGLVATKKSLGQSHIPFAIGMSPMVQGHEQGEWLQILSRNQRYVGLWIFPAGRPWSRWMKEL